MRASEMSGMIYKPKEASIQFPSLWLPGSPLPSSRGMPGYPCCCEDECRSYCIDDNLPDEVQVTISGLTDRSCTQEECDVLNATHILAWDPVAFNPCRWWITVASECSLMNSPASSGGIYAAIRLFLGVPTWQVGVANEIYIGVPMAFDSNCLTWSETLSHFSSGATFFACNDGELLTVDIDAI